MGDNYLKEQYIQSWNYLKESRKFIFGVILLFILFSLVGFFIPAPAGLTEKILEFFQRLIEQTKDMSQSELIWFILKNNVWSSFSGMAFGFFFGIFPVVATVVNGYLLGFVAFLSVQGEGILSLWKLFPHGIFELPALFISLGLGLRFGNFIFQHKKAEAFRDYLWNGLRVFIWIVIPLLIIAALIEGSLIIFLN